MKSNLFYVVNYVYDFVDLGAKACRLVLKRLR